MRARVRDGVACSCEQMYDARRTEHVFSPHDLLRPIALGRTNRCEVHVGGSMGSLGNNLG